MDVVIIGGGLAGLISSILLAREGWRVTLIEKKSYPFHRVCGEYISNEVIPFLQLHKLYPEALKPARISRFLLSDTGGNAYSLPLDLGGFGISRYNYDHWLSQQAVRSGVHLMTETTVQSITYIQNQFRLKTSQGELNATYAIGAFGKRANLDRELKRTFFHKKSPYLGVKYHVKNDNLDPDYISLHNFRGGYCGVSQVDGGRYNICYLSERKNLRTTSSIEKMEEKVLFQNTRIQSLFESSDFLFDAPLVINEISFAPKEPVVNHMLMTGDAAGMITPLCGNGMAMAIHGAKILSEHLIQHNKIGSSRQELELSYTKEWKRTFQGRHWAGRQIQSALFGTHKSSKIALNIAKKLPRVAQWLMKQTHGQPFS